MQISSWQVLHDESKVTSQVRGAAGHHTDEVPMVAQLLHHVDLQQEGALLTGTGTDCRSIIIELTWLVICTACYFVLGYVSLYTKAALLSFPSSISVYKINIVGSTTNFFDYTTLFFVFWDNLFIIIILIGQHPYSYIQSCYHTLWCAVKVQKRCAIISWLSIVLVQLNQSKPAGNT